MRTKHPQDRIDSLIARCPLPLLARDAVSPWHASADSLDTWTVAREAGFHFGHGYWDVSEDWDAHLRPTETAALMRIHRLAIEFVAQLDLLRRWRDQEVIDAAVDAMGWKEIRRRGGQNPMVWLYDPVTRQMIRNVEI